MSVPNPPEVTPCPSPAPSTTDTINFDARADQYHAWLPNFVNVQLAAVIEWIRLRANEVQGWANSVASAVTAAATSATNAANSATSAGTSATSAGTSATSAGTSAAAAQASLNTFRGQYYGPLAADPTADPLGNAPGEGDLYWHTGTKTMRAFNGTAWAQSYLPASAYMDLVSAQTVAGVKTFSSNPVLSAGTANALAYLNSGKTLSFSADLTFDGTTITSTGGSLYLKGTNSDTPMAGNYVRFGTNIGLQSNAANSALVAKMFNGSTFVDALTLNTSGNLGLGVTPSAWNAGSPVIQMAGGTSIYADSNQTIYGLNAAFISGFKYVVSDFASQYVQVNGQHQWQTAPSGTAGNAITFTQAMTLDASGNLLVGTTSAGLSNSNSTSNQFDGNGRVITINHAGGPAGSLYMQFGYNGTKIGSITVATSSSVAYNTSSDYRLKNITGPITNSGAYIDSLNPVEGTWKADGSTFVGLIAHEAQEASRTPVATGEKDGEQMQGMDYSSAEIIGNMIAELKSLRARVAALESN